jgi:predicted DNA-binding protein YlxM (UPF0122 family)
LLTEKQRTVFEMSVFNDMSLAEIAGELGITPQGVRDFLKRTEKILDDYETSLELVKRHTERKRIIEELTDMINTLSINLNEKCIMQKNLKELL